MVNFFWTRSLRLFAVQFLPIWKSEHLSFSTLSKNSILATIDNSKLSKNVWMKLYSAPNLKSPPFLIKKIYLLVRFGNLILNLILKNYPQQLVHQNCHKMYVFVGIFTVLLI